MKLVSNKSTKVMPGPSKSNRLIQQTFDLSASQVPEPLLSAGIEREM